MPDKRTPKDFLDWLNLKEVPDWAKARPLGALVGLMLIVLFALALAALVGVLFHTIHQAFSPDSDGPNLGAGALIAALLGAPFVIWGTVLKHRTVTFQKEGHITDRINKAVEMLGAEKKVDRIGRAVTIWTGTPEIVECREADAGLFEGRPRTKIAPFEFTGEYGEAAAELERKSERGSLLKVTTWPSERSVVEYEGKELALSEGEVVGIEGEWKVFSETVPNIEVRIGAILSLERIAQDSTAYDKGRDHVRVMEILCAYVRENSYARKPLDFSQEEWKPLKVGADDATRAAHLEKREDRFGGTYAFSQAWKWARTLPAPRADISQALTVLGRRTLYQRKVEAAWPDPPKDATVWPFEEPWPKLPEKKQDEATTEAEIAQFKSALVSWKKTLSNYGGYRLDLRGSNLQRADLSRTILSGADLAEARLEGAKFFGAQIVGARLGRVRMEGASFHTARLQGAFLSEARMEGANLNQAWMEGAYLGRARMEGANLQQARMEGAKLWQARMEAADLWLARMEGANLKQAWMHWANLTGAWMEGADLRQARMEWATLMGAQMEGANLNQAQLEGANFSGAHMQGVNLSEALMEGADLWQAQMEGAKLWQVQMNASTGLPGAVLRGASLRNVNCTNLPLFRDQIDQVFGDGSVILSEGMERPAHWPEWVLRGGVFEKEWRQWQADPAAYTPPPKPE